MEVKESTNNQKGVVEDGTGRKITGADSGGIGSCSSGSSSDGSRASGSGKAGRAKSANGSIDHSDSGNPASGAGNQGSGRGNNGDSGSGSGSSSGSGGSAGRTAGTGGTAGTGTEAGGNRTSEVVLEKSNFGLTEQKKAPKSVKPSIANGKKKGANAGKSEVTSPDFLAATLGMAFGFLATMTGHQHWKLADEEAEAVAEPLALVLDQLPSKVKQKMNKATAPMMLGAALATVVIPRVIIEFSYHKGGMLNARNQRQNARASEGNRIENPQPKPAAVSAGNTESVKNVSPVTTEVDPAISQLLNGDN